MKMIDGELYPEEPDSSIKEFNNKKKTNSTPISLNKTEGSSLYNKYVIKHGAKKEFMINKIIEGITHEIEFQTSRDHNNFLTNPKNLAIEVPVQRIYEHFSRCDYINDSDLKRRVCYNTIENTELMPTCDRDVYEYIYKNFKDIKERCETQGIYIKKKSQNKYYIEDYDNNCSVDKEADILIECRFVKRFNPPKIHFKFSLDELGAAIFFIAVIFLIVLYIIKYIIT